MSESQVEVKKEELIDLKTTENIHVYEKFEEMNLKQELLRSIFSCGYETPSHIQQRAIVPCYEGRDCVIQAQSGTGKTATFSIALVQRVLNAFEHNPVHVCRAIVLSPTRELATQSHGVIIDLLKHTNLVCHALVGGRNVRANIDDIQKGVDIICGTPGRVFHLIKDNVLRLNDLLLIVLDEADEMLSKGFRACICNLVQLMPSTGQIVLVSATLPYEVLNLAKEFLQNPFCILVKQEDLTLSGISQYYVRVQNQENKIDTLKMIYDSLAISKAIIFCNSINTVKVLCEVLHADKYPVEAMHGQMDQNERDRVINIFRSENCRVLISSDLLSRGLDMQRVNLVINFDLPNDRQSYLHRIGRSGRYGRKGTAINFVCDSEDRILTDIKEHYQTSIDELPSNLEL